MNISESRHQEFFSKFETFTLRMSLTEEAEFTLNITVGVHKFTEHGNVSRNQAVAQRHSKHAT